MNAPATVSGDGNAPLGQGWHGSVPDAHLEERRRERHLDLIEVEVELVAPDAGQPDIEDEVRVGARGQEGHEGRLAVDRRGVDLCFLETGLADPALLDRDRLGPSSVVELDEEDLAGPGLGSATASGDPE